jgi:pyruvate formate lyase activating enzyme
MEAAYYTTREDGTVRCELCPSACIIAPGHTGACSVRGNRNGMLQADAYGEVVSLSVDPIEKKPLYHFHPSKPILSTGPNGCNFQCGFCQNHTISQERVQTRNVSPETLAEMAGRRGSIGVAYTYTEPFIWFEYLRDAGAAVHERGLKNVLVSNGYVNEGPLRELLPLIDAMNVDVKAMKPDFYSKVCGGRLEDVLKTVEIAAGQCHVEITNLVIPGYNDSDEDFIMLRDWVADLRPTIPVHYSRYYPQFRFTEAQTPPETIERALSITREKLPYVYAGNIVLADASDTYCPACGALLVSRNTYSVSVEGIADGVCGNCGVPTDFVGV